MKYWETIADKFSKTGWSFAQLLSERKEKRKRVGVITLRWVQTRERNEALDLMCMVLCILEMYRGQLDTMEPLIATSEKDQKNAQPAVKFGAQKMIASPLELRELHD